MANVSSFTTKQCADLQAAYDRGLRITDADNEMQMQRLSEELGLDVTIIKVHKLIHQLYNTADNMAYGYIALGLKLIMNTLQS